MAITNESYFNTLPWSDRVKAYLADGKVDRFVGANYEAITRSLRDRETGLRMVVNIGGDALLSFLAGGRYLNAYELPKIIGGKKPPSETRIRVDAALGLEPPDAFYFGAAAIGGTGVRFYGEYCMVLKPEKVDGNTRVFDRNSYDLTRPPFEENDLAPIVSMLGGQWSNDLVHMLTMKLIPEIQARQWLITLGTVSDAILHDEEFIEVHREGTFEPGDLEEVRLTPEDEALHQHILRAYEEGQAPSLEEMLWVTRRNRVRRKLTALGIPARVVTSSGRGNRWK